MTRTTTITVHLCDLCEQETAVLYPCAACNREFCRTCEGILFYALAPRVCRACEKRPGLHAVLQEYQPQIGKLVADRDAAVAALRGES